MQKREIFKDVEINGRRFRVGKFDALTGSYIAYKLLMEMLPMGLELQMGLTLPTNRSAMSREDFTAIQKECLMVCSEITAMKSGTEMPVQILLASGDWGCPDLREDVMTVIMLTIHVLVFNVSSFFEGDALKGFRDKIQALSPFSAQTSMDSPTPRQSQGAGDNAKFGTEHTP